MGKYQRSPEQTPAIFEANQWNGDADHLVPGMSESFRADDDGALWPVYQVTTIQGVEVAVMPGDYVIQEPDGIHYYPCKADIFEQRYMPVSDASASRHVSPPEPVVLTEEEEDELREVVGDGSFEDFEDWLTEHGFALVRTKAVADGA